MNNNTNNKSDNTSINTNLIRVQIIIIRVISLINTMNLRLYVCCCSVMQKIMKKVLQIDDVYKNLRQIWKYFLFEFCLFSNTLEWAIFIVSNISKKLEKMNSGTGFWKRKWNL